MLKRYFNNYNSFLCAADNCEATCCTGWQIEIDDTTLNRYKAMGFDKEVDYEQSTFLWNEEGYCHFLRDDGLCKLVLSGGEENLCYTCHMYPRHIEEFEGVREYSLSMSCPTVAEQILKQTEIQYFDETEDDEVDELEYDPAEQQMYDLLFALRLRIFAVLSQKNLPLTDRCGFFLSMIYSFQEEIDFADEEYPFDMDEFLAEYDERISAGEYENFAFSEEATKQYFETLEQWEYLDKSWGEEIEKLKAVLFNSDARQLSQEFNSKFNFGAKLEQIIWYFIYTYFCGSIYDEYYFAQAQLAVARWLLNGKEITEEEICKIAYEYSRELEHSDENILLMEKLMENMPVFFV